MPKIFDPNTPHTFVGAADRLPPEVAAEAFRVTAAWSVVEALQGELLAHLVDGNASAVAAVYVTIRNTPQARAAIENVVRAGRLDDDLSKEIESILKEVAKLAEERNSLAHGITAFSPEHPGSLVTCSLRSYVELHAATHDDRGIEEGFETQEQLGAWADRRDVALLKMTLYDADDLRELRGRMQALAARFIPVLRRLKPERYRARDEMAAIWGRVRQ